MTPQPGGLEPTPVDRLPIIVCPNCGHEIPPLARPARNHAGQVVSPATVLNRSVELEDATPTIGQAVNPRLAPTDRISRD